MNTFGKNAEEDIDQFLEFVSAHARSVLIAVITTIMFMIPIYAASNSLWKAIGFGSVIFFAAGFDSWRRYLQFIGLAAFLITVLLCCIDIPVIRIATGG
jgi:hypothetical protein